MSFEEKYPDFKEIIAPFVPYFIRPFVTQLEGVKYVVFTPEGKLYYWRFANAQHVINDKITKYLESSRNQLCVNYYSDIFNNIHKLNYIYVDFITFYAAIKIDNINKKLVVFLPAIRTQVVNSLINKFKEFLYEYTKYTFDDLLQGSDKYMINFTNKQELQMQVFYEAREYNKLLIELKQLINDNIKDKNRIEEFETNTTGKLMNKLIQKIAKLEAAKRYKDVQEANVMYYKYINIIDDIEDRIEKRNNRIDEIKKIQLEIKNKREVLMKEISQLKDININCITCVYWMFNYTTNIDDIKPIFDNNIIVYKFIQQKIYHYKFKQHHLNLYWILKYMFNRQCRDSQYREIAHLMLLKNEGKIKLIENKLNRPSDYYSHETQELIRKYLR